ncbi:MAG: hypothetical protein ACREM2_03160 [Vulcanimicrobiaceae bacterium]
MTPQPVATTVVFYIAIAALILFRASRAQRLSVTRMWISAGLLILIAAFAVYGHQALSPAPAWQIALAVVLGLAAGVPVGLLRGHHTAVSATAKRGVMLLGASWATAAIYIGAFLVRALILSLVPRQSVTGTVIGDGLLVFAMTIIGATYFAVYRKYRALGAPQIARA